MDPLDLFSDNPKGAGLDQPSSPVSKEHQLARLKEELLETKAGLTAEIDQLELEMNQLINKEKEENEKLRKEEEDTILRLLVEAEQEEEQIAGSQHTRNEVQEDDDEDELDEFDAKPSRKWDERLEYLKRLYPDTIITNASSHISLDYIDDKKALIKNIQFDLNIGNIIRFKIHLKLNKYKATYQVFDLILTKTSNNKLNTLLLKISSHFTKTKNINSFLLSLNSLYQELLKRYHLFQSFEEWSYRDHILNNTMEYKKLALYYDIVFEEENLRAVYTTNQAQLSPVLDLYIKSYGIASGLRKFVSQVDVLLSEVIEVV